MSRKTRPLPGLALLAIAASISACGSSAPAETGTGGRNNTPSKREQAVKYAECMRSNGVRQFPDPDASGKLTIDAVANSSSVDLSAPAFKRAISACKHLQPAGFTGSKRSPQQQNAALQFAECIRANGVTDFPDPTANSPLVDTTRIPSAADPGGMSILNAAMQKCSDAARAAGVTR